MIHLSEIELIVVESTAAYVSTYLLSELAKAKIPVVFCDLQHNPVGQYAPLYGSHDAAGKVREQVAWEEAAKLKLWKLIVETKIRNQASVLKGLNKDEHCLLEQYAGQVQPGDSSNREGHAAKVYFNALFGKKFSRDLECPTNAMLDYGYSILLSWTNKEIVSRGYLTQLGIIHRNEYNPFNLACDFMEPFRPVIDRYVKENEGAVFDQDTKVGILELFSRPFGFCEGSYRLSSIIGLVVRSNLAILSGRAPIESYLEFSLNEE